MKNWQQDEWRLGPLAFMDNAQKIKAVIKKITPRTRILFEVHGMQPHTWEEVIVEDLYVHEGTYNLFYDDSTVVLTKVPLSYDFSEHQFIDARESQVDQVDQLDRNVIGYIPHALVRKADSLVEIEVQGETVVQFFSPDDIKRHRLAVGEIDILYDEQIICIL